MGTYIFRSTYEEAVNKIYFLKGNRVEEKRKPRRMIFQFQTKQVTKTPRILITGSLGQLGTGLAKKLRAHYGAENVIMSDIIKAPKQILDAGPYIYADILDFKNLRNNSQLSNRLVGPLQRSSKCYRRRQRSL
ncbi:l-threonine 3-dehydrogenase, mitochondrial [Caerostris extrusa]|uniref:L-threonine 3-dehydrogenase, mitochondrial n=1 Tax=Caerostris extrusa TaxID=172846 RepID=A0AAV4R5C9_CAEEX|nr:l-threonine 3-dehydrogenase, mitochondrial [Caerostris extrusa]